MLETNLLCLVLAYVFLSLLMLTVLIGLALPRLVKIGAIVVASLFYVVVFFSMQGLLGWSAPVGVPARFQVLWTRIVEPNVVQGETGAIHLWLEELDAANLPTGEPRAYHLPYTTNLAGRVAKAQKEIEKGNLQGGRAEFFGTGASQSVPTGPLQTGAPPGGDPSGGGLFDPAFLGGQSRNVDLVPLPKPALPPKDMP